MTTITTRQHNRHTEQCTGCGATPRESHDDDCRGHLKTGIRHHRAARRYLRRKFGQSAHRRPITRCPGARFYVTGRAGVRVVYLLGPYVSHMTALERVPQACRQLAEQFPHEVPWLRVGTASRPDTVATRLGR